MNINLSSCRSIALVRRNALGDLLSAMPLLNYVRRAAPKARIFLMVEKNNACLAPYLQGYDELVILPRAHKYLGLVKLRCKAKRWNLDLAISAKPTPMKLNNLILRALCAQQQAAWILPSWHANWISHPSLFDIQHNDEHRALKTLHLLAPELTEIPETLYPKLKIPEVLKQRYGAHIQEALATLKVRAKPLLMVSVSYNRAHSFLGVEATANLLNRLARERDFSVVVSAEAKDATLATQLVAQLKAPSLPLVTQSFDEFIQLINAVDVLLVGDGGIMHMAAALDKPTVVLFAQTRLDHWRPLSQKAICFYDALHVKNISTEQILDALKQQLDILHV